jgi:uncharacterized alpha-E superfamily protein
MAKHIDGMTTSGTFPQGCERSTHTEKSTLSAMRSLLAEGYEVAVHSERGAYIAVLRSGAAVVIYKSKPHSFVEDAVIAAFDWFHS